MLEVSTFVPEIIKGTNPLASSPQRTEIPPHLTRRNLRQMQRDNCPTISHLWGERGIEVEQIALSAIASLTDIVEDAVLNPPSAKEGDIRVKFVKGFGVAELIVEVKSSTHGIKEYKEGIIATLPRHRGQPRHVRRHMADNKIVLVNAGESHGKEKTREEIINDSVLPQFERIRNKSKVLMGHLANSLHEYQAKLASQEKPIQIFPAVTEDEQLTLPHAS